MTIAIPTTASDFSTSSSGSAASVTLNKPANLADGDVLIAFVYFRNASTTFGPPAGWTAITNSLVTANQSSQGYYKPISSAAGEPSTYQWTFTGGSARVDGILFRATGVDPTTPIDAVGTQSPVTGFTSVVIPAVTAVSPVAMLVAYALTQNATTTASALSTPTGMTQIAQDAFNNGASSTDTAMFFKLLSASGSTGSITSNISPNSSNSSGFAFTLNPLIPPDMIFSKTVTVG